VFSQLNHDSRKLLRDVLNCLMLPLCVLVANRFTAGLVEQAVTYLRVYGNQRGGSPASLSAASSSTRYYKVSPIATQGLTLGTVFPIAMSGLILVRFYQLPRRALYWASTRAFIVD
jgi:hypothetical protein